MRFLRTRLAAVALIAAVLSAATAPLFAAPRHAVCASARHDCGKPAKIAKCCCTEQGQRSNEPGPVEARIHLNPQFEVTPGLFVAAISADDVHTMVRVHASPPRSSPIDLPTLFATLLI